MKSASIYEKVNKIDSKIENLEAAKWILIVETQAKCKHPDIVKYMSDYPYYSVVCKKCGLREKESTGFRFLVKSHYDVPELSNANRYVLNTITRDESYILSYPMRHSVKDWKYVINDIGRPIWDRYVNRESHIVDGSWGTYKDEMLDED